MSRCPPCSAQLTQRTWNIAIQLQHLIRVVIVMLFEDGLNVSLCPTQHCNFSPLQVTSETNLYCDCKLFLPLLNTSIGGCHINKRIRTFVLFSLYNNYPLLLPRPQPDCEHAAAFEVDTKTTCQNNPPAKIVILALASTRLLTVKTGKIAHQHQFYKIRTNCNLTFPAFTAARN